MVFERVLLANFELAILIILLGIRRNADHDLSVPRHSWPVQPVDELNVTSMVENVTLERSSPRWVKCLCPGEWVWSIHAYYSFVFGWRMGHTVLYAKSERHVFIVSFLVLCRQLPFISVSVIPLVLISPNGSFRHRKRVVDNPCTQHIHRWRQGRSICCDPFV